MIIEVLFGVSLVIGPCLGMVWSTERGGDQCDALIIETIAADRATAADDTPSRLHSTWLSQGCETRSGPEYVIRKYTFYENGTFLLLRHHYAEESCSIVTHTVTARGVLRLLSLSILTPGATEARFQLGTVHIVPLNSQVAHKLGRRVNSSCGPQPKWRPYVPQLVYEQPQHRVANPLWEGPRYNFLQGHRPSRKRQGIDCLETLGIEFGELRLLRVQKRPYGSKTTIPVSNTRSPARPRVELLLGSLPPSTQVRFTHRPTGLQPTTLLRADTINGCPMCNTISRGTETNPPVLHEVAALPALLGGSWLSRACESIDGGLWIRRQFQFWSGDKLWAGRWDHFSDPKCNTFLYAVTAAGSYVQRAGRQRRHHLDQSFEYIDGDLPEIEQDDYQQDTSEERVSFQSRITPFGTPKSPNKKRKRREVVPWMTPELAKNIWDIYAPKREEIAAEGMLPTIDEILEAITRKSEETVKLEGNTDHVYSTSGDKKSKRSLDVGDDSYRHLLQNAQPSLAESFTAMLRGNQRYQETTAKPSPITVTPPTPMGTTELDLHVAESILIPGDPGVVLRCGGRGRQLTVWPRDCVPRALEAPATLGLKARVGVTWSGEYTLLLGSREGSLWEAPLHQCGPTSLHNPELRSRLRLSVGLRYGLFSSSSATPVMNGVLEKSIVFGLFVILRQMR